MRSMQREREGEKETMNKLNDKQKSYLHIYSLTSPGNPWNPAGSFKKNETEEAFKEVIVKPLLSYPMSPP